eukprot:TRINITY_DN1559_c0_g1_i1.p1 TRINITY_DN1559_c0_g1~~TRINITY_DN1559_c0_g1_i1.p1  ORF type:complete len:208 (+),score=78.81 TRINITY_DN1559_c0_g1_i1:43-666(+)
MEGINAHGRQVKYLKSVAGTLNDEERGWVEEVLQDCKIHEMAIAKLYTWDQGRGYWEYTGCIGGTAVVTEHGLYGVPAHYLRMADLLAWNPNNALMFEQEMYQNFVYHKTRPYLHVFEMNEGMAALSFSDVTEADRFYDAVQMCISTLPKDVLKPVAAPIVTEAISHPAEARSGLHGGKVEKVADLNAPGIRKIDAQGKKKKKGFFG